MKPRCAEKDLEVVLQPCKIRPFFVTKAMVRWQSRPVEGALDCGEGARRARPVRRKAVARDDIGISTGGMGPVGHSWFVVAPFARGLRTFGLSNRALSFCPMALDPRTEQ
jgi:hypothetical protein